jgi:hypothetical protein
MSHGPWRFKPNEIRAVKSVKSTGLPLRKCRNLARWIDPYQSWRAAIGRHSRFRSKPQKSEARLIQRHWHADAAVHHAVGEPTMKTQVPIRPVSTEWIMRSTSFERGFDDARKGIPFDRRIGDNTDAQWNCERGRLLAHIAPLNMPLRIGGKLNAKAVALCDVAFDRDLIT